MILHDSEDVLHPLELQLFNYLLIRASEAGAVSTCGAGGRLQFDDQQ